MNSSGRRRGAGVAAIGLNGSIAVAASAASPTPWHVKNQKQVKIMPQNTKIPVYDAEFFEPSAKRQRGLGLCLHIALMFVLLTALLIAVIGYIAIN